MSSLTTLQDSRSSETSSLESAVQTSQPISGGLWTPTKLPTVSENELRMMTGMTYRSIADAILSKFDF